jgi:AcrR family transcriptional regulator
VDAPPDLPRDWPPSGEDPEVERLLSAAQTVLGRSGWWGFKVESVLREARLSTRSFYRHFQSKAELLLAVLESEMELAALRLERAASVDGDARAQLDSWVEATLAMAYHQNLAKRAPLFAEHWRELLAEFPDRMQVVVGRLISTVVPVLARGRDGGTWPSAVPEDDGLCVFFLVSGLTADIAVGLGMYPHDKTKKTLMNFIERALGGGKAR